jgi:RNA polymerase sigma factor for flagellar operon FliA
MGGGFIEAPFVTSHQQSNSTRPDDPTDPLVLEYAPLVRHVVGKVAPRGIVGVDREDLISAGVLGLVRAARRYDPDHPAEFKTYAYACIRGAVLEELRRRRKAEASRTADGWQSVVSLQELTEEGASGLARSAESGPTPDQQAEQNESLTLLAEAIDDLPRRERVALVLYAERHLTLKQIARVLGVTEGRASQLHSAAVAKLSDRLTEKRAA